MNTLGVIIVSTALPILGGGAWWFYQGGPGASKPIRQGTTAPAVIATKGAPNSVQLEQDQAIVFQRAFWRRPQKGDHIIGAERRVWFDETSAVQKWQWFVAVDPSPEFRHWLIDENPFGIVATAAGTPPPSFEKIPAWFPSQAKLASCIQFRARGSHFVIFIDPKSGQLFAADSGAGFAAAQH